MKIKFKIDPSHWAYIDGQKAGRDGNTYERGLMHLAFAKLHAKDRINVRQWLAGFESQYKN